eukprot:COSAG02_NODE_18091_length_961_cov_2.990719_1_plen_227_part_10
MPPHHTEPWSHGVREEGAISATQHNSSGLESAHRAAAAPSTADDEWEEDLFAPVPDEAVALICSFLGAQDLGRMACVARRFTERVLTEPDIADKVSAIEQGAILRAHRLLVAAGLEFTPPERQEDESWLRMLSRVEHTPRFVPCPFGLFTLAENGALATRISGPANESQGSHNPPRYPAVLAGVVMSSGKHVAEMELVSLNGWAGGVFFGVNAEYITFGLCFKWFLS